MSQEQYPDEKVDIEAGLPGDTAPLLKQSDEPDVDERVVHQPQRRQLSTKKKLLLGGLAGFLVFSAARACHSRHHKSGLQKWTGDWDYSNMAPSAPSPYDYQKDTWVRMGFVPYGSDN